MMTSATPSLPLAPLLLAAMVGIAAPARGEEAPRMATPVGTWDGGPVKDGGQAYCLQRAKYSSGHTLIIGRLRSGSVNVAMTIPGGALPVGERWSVSVRVDGALPRERVATAVNATTLVVTLGLDPDLFTQMRRGKALYIKSAADHIGFAMTGTAKALNALERCAEGLPASPEDGKGAASSKSGEGAGGAAKDGAAKDGAAKGPPVFPETLSAILGAAGMTEIQALTFPDLPPEKRPADYAWRVGEVLGGVRERMVPADVTLDALTTEHAEALRARCRGAGSARLSPIERHRDVSIRLGSVDCAPGAGPDGKGKGVHVALVSYLSEARVFATFFHEVVPENAAVADDIRDRLAAVFRRVAAMPKEDVAPKTVKARPPAPAAAPAVQPIVPVPSAPQAQTPEPTEPAPIEPTPTETTPEAAPSTTAPAVPEAGTPAAVAPSPVKPDPAKAVAPAKPATPAKTTAPAKTVAPAKNTAPAKTTAPAKAPTTTATKAPVSTATKTAPAKTPSVKPSAPTPAPTPSPAGTSPAGTSTKSR